MMNKETQEKNHIAHRSSYTGAPASQIIPVN